MSDLSAEGQFLKELREGEEVLPEPIPYVPPKVLVGWSPGAEEIELPASAFRPVTPEQQALCDNFCPDKTWREKQVPPEREFFEFPIYYGKTEERRSRRTLNRQGPVRGYLFNSRAAQQERAICESLRNGVGLVLASHDFTVYRAESIWGLLWVYFKYQVKKIWLKRRSGSLKMPSYTKAKCQPRKPKGRTLFSRTRS